MQWDHKSMSQNDLAIELVKVARKKGLRIAVAESCTGGLLSAAITDIAGASDVFDCGFITYANAAKTELIGVPNALIESRGAVSREVAIAMADGALKHGKVDVSAAITGLAGPGGGSAEKPVGLVYIATAQSDRPTAVTKHRFNDGGRATIRSAAVNAALKALLSAVEAL